MRCKLGFVLLATALAGCSHVPYDEPSRGVAAVNVPVLTRADYVFDAAAPDGSLSPAESARLDGWFRSLDLGYGDSIYVDGAYAGAARDDVAQVAGRYGLLVSDGAPVTAGAVQPGTVRVVVSRDARHGAELPQLERAVAAQFRQSQHVQLRLRGEQQSGRDGRQPRRPDPRPRRQRRRRPATATKAVQSYRNAAPTGQQGLQDISTKKKDQ